MEIQGYENYLIFKNGSVLSKGSKYNKPKFLQHCYNSAGYAFVNLRDGKGGGRPYFIHVLLSRAYIANPENKPFVDHIDRNKKNNSLYNLKWATSKENNNNMPFERKINKNNTTGHQYITTTECGYRFQRTKNGIKYSKRFKTLDEALRYKEEINSLLCKFPCE